jgi:hypothetical protein
MTTKQVTRGPFRINLEKPESRTYYEVVTTKGTEIIWVRDSRVAFNNSVRKYGHHLLNIYNLETGGMVVGGK